MDTAREFAPRGSGIFSAEQEELRDAARRFLSDRSSSESVRVLMGTDAGFDDTVWKQIAELGWTAIAIPESYGGLGSGFVELGILFEEMGRRLFCAPFLSAVILGAGAILNGGTEEQKRNLLPGVADGTARPTLALAEASGRWDAEGISATARRVSDGWILDGTKTFVLDGTTATLLVVAARTGGPGTAGISLFAVDPWAEGVVREPLETLDLTRKQARIVLREAPAALLGAEGAGWPAVERTLDQAAVALASEMVGGAQRCLDLSVAYAKDRVQFGRPIGSFQAIKHKCADMLTEVEMARSAAYYAAWAATEQSDELPVVAPLAKAYCAEAFCRAAGETIQIHGGIGFTFEHDAHLYFRRARSSDALLGDARYQRALLAERLGL